MVSEITFVRESFIALRTLNLAVSRGCDVVDFEQVFIVKEDVDRLLTVLAIPLHVPLSEMEPDLVDQIMSEITVRLWALEWVFGVGGPPVIWDELRPSFA